MLKYILCSLSSFWRPQPPDMGAFAVIFFD